MTFEEAWRVVKMPILEPQPGIRFGYNSLEPVNEPQQAIDDMVDDSRYLDHRDYQLIGMPPYAWNNRDAIKYMTPDDYFDKIQELEPNDVGSRGEKFRWAFRSSPANISNIIEGIKEGKIIGMPELQVRGDNDEWVGMQEGGHRMEALRQLGFADTPVPVFLHRRR